MYGLFRIFFESSPNEGEWWYVSNRRLVFATEAEAQAYLEKARSNHWLTSPSFKVRAID